MGDVLPDPQNNPPLYISGCATESSYVFAPLISMPSFESIDFYQNKLKIKLFLQNNTNFLSAEGSGARPPKRPFPISDFWLRAGYDTYAAHSSKF